MNLPSIWTLSWVHAQAHVADQLCIEASLNLTSSDLVSFSAIERRCVDSNGHRQAWFVHGDHRHRARILRVAQCLANGDVFNSCHCDDLARSGLVHLYALMGLGYIQNCNLGSFNGSIGAAPRNLLALSDSSVQHTTHGQAANELTRVQVGDPSLKRVIGLIGRSGQVRDE